jgi:U3 small nucleolar RNA-associated protein 3
LNIFFSFQEPHQKDKEVEEEVIKTDLRKLSKREKLALLQKESPEFFGLIEDFKGKVCLWEITVQ